MGGVSRDGAGGTRKEDACGGSVASDARLRLKVAVFSSKPDDGEVSFPAVQRDGLDVSFVLHQGRISQSYIESVDDLDGKAVYLCGPETFERNILQMLNEAGYKKPVVRESFEY